MRTTLAGVLALVALGSQSWAFEVNHPVYDPGVTQGQVAGLKVAVAPLMAMSDDELRAFVPKVNGFLFCGCPNCDLGTQEGQLRWKGISDPDKAVCRHCGQEYPDPEYPENKTKTGVNFKGETVTYQFHEDPGGTEYFLTGRISYDKKLWLAGRAQDLARVYAATQDEQYARKAAVLLDALAEAYSHWCVHYDWPFQKKGPVKPEPPFPTAGGMWNRWFYCDVPIDVTRAYDMIAHSPEIGKLSEELGVDVRRRIEDDFLRRSIWFVRTYKEEYSNMSPGIYEGLITVGRVLGEPGYVHDGVNRFKGLLERQFFYDGFWREGSIAYHDQTVHWLARVADTVKGYSDPEGYVCPEDGERYDGLDVMGQFPLARTALGMNKRFVYPNGAVIPTHDAWPKASHAALTRSEPFLLPGMGHAVLGCGEGASQTQAHLHFSGGWGHEHRDNLHMSLFAQGHELLPDLGYTHSKFREWTVCTPAHNTVAIDEGEHGSSRHRCNLLLWAPKVGPAQVVEAEARATYPDKAQEFRRMLALVQISPEHAYAVDIFRVEGGSRHDYFLHGSADADQSAEASVDLSPMPESLLGPGAEYSLPSFGESDRGKAAGGRNVCYGFIEHLRGGEAEGSVDVSFRFKDRAPQVYTGTFPLPGPAQVVLGDAPSIRRAGEDDGKVAQYRMPVLALRRSGEEGLDSVFVGVHRGWSGEDFIKSVRLLPGVAEADGVVALEVEHALGRDVIFACTEGAAIDAQTGKVLCDARFGIVSYREGRAAALGLVGGTVLDVEGLGVKAEGPVEGDLIGTTEQGDRHGLLVAEALEPGTALRGSLVMVRHEDGRTHGHFIDSVERAAAGAVIWLTGDPGFELAEGKTRFISFPQGEATGDVTYRIENTVSVGEWGGE